VKFKDDVNTEPYIESLMGKRKRIVLAQFRCAILPLNVEDSGNYKKVKTRREKLWSL